MLLFHDVAVDAGAAGSHAAHAAAAANTANTAAKTTTGKKGLPKHRGKDEEDAGGRQTRPVQVRLFHFFIPGFVFLYFIVDTTVLIPLLRSSIFKVHI